MQKEEGEGVVGALKEETHSEGALGIVKAVMGCTNLTKSILMLYLNHLMEHKSTALGFLEMDVG